MLASTFGLLDQSNLGQQPAVKKFFKALFNLRPPKPKYTETWNVNVVLQFLTTQGPNENLQLKLLSEKLVMLLALSTMARVSDLVAIDRSSIKFDEEKVSFVLAKPRKAQREGNLHILEIRRLSDTVLCPVDCLGFYLNLTETLRNNQNSDYLFISHTRPHKKVTANSLARWIKSLMKKSGIDNSFSAHSTRSAAASKAWAAGIPVDTILKKGHWTKETIFTKFYCRKPPSQSIETVILNNN